MMFRIGKMIRLHSADNICCSLLALLGGCVTSIVQLAAQTFLRTDPVLVKVNQPNVLSLHVEFLRVCTHDDSIIKVIPLKVGGTVSTLQLQLLYVKP